MPVPKKGMVLFVIPVPESTEEEGFDGMTAVRGRRDRSRPVPAPPLVRFVEKVRGAILVERTLLKLTPSLEGLLKKANLSQTVLGLRDDPLFYRAGGHKTSS